MKHIQSDDFSWVTNIFLGHGKNSSGSQFFSGSRTILRACAMTFLNNFNCEQPRVNGL